jgi:2-methylcitrate dehydratase PrpD
MNAMPRPAAPALEAQAERPLIAGTLAQFAHGLDFNAIPAEVRERAKHLMLDATGIAYASGGYDFAHKTLTAIAGLGGSGQVPVIGLPQRLSPRDAALVNGVLAHGLDFDDTHTGGIIHSTASLWPAVLSAAFWRGKSGADLVTAYVAGVEAATRLGAVGSGHFHQVGFHPTGMIGVFG